MSTEKQLYSRIGNYYKVKNPKNKTQKQYHKKQSYKIIHKLIEIQNEIQAWKEAGILRSDCIAYALLSENHEIKEIIKIINSISYNIHRHRKQHRKSRVSFLDCVRFINKQFHTPILSPISSKDYLDIKQDEEDIDFAIRDRIEQIKCVIFLSNNNFNISSKDTGIYIIYEKKDIVAYVGMSMSSLLERSRCSIEERNLSDSYSKIKFIKLNLKDKKETTRIEDYLIWKHNPYKNVKRKYQDSPSQEEIEYCEEAIGNKQVTVFDHSKDIVNYMYLSMHCCYNSYKYRPIDDILVREYSLG